jgi:TatD DNase family protein
MHLTYVECHVHFTLSATFLAQRFPNSFRWVSMSWADSHCHVHDPRLDTDAVFAAAVEARLRLMVTVGCDEETSLAAIDIATRADDHEAAHNAGLGVWATVGLHPHDATDGLHWISPLLDRAKELRVLAVGECGLDYYYEHSPRDVQQRIFAEQIALAHAYDLPLVIHTRDAWDDTFAVLDAEGTPATTIFHCFSGGVDEAQRCLALHDGVYLSFSGIVTFKTAEDLRSAAAVTPLSRLLIETDSPYLAPMPHRGKRNQPAFVTLVGAQIAEVKACSVDDIEQATWNATVEAFRLTADGLGLATR